MGDIRIPLHRNCIESGKLCNSCKSKMETRAIGEWEVEVMKALLEISKTLPLNHRYESSAIAGSTLYIALEGPPVKDLESELMRRIKIKGVTRIRVIYYGGGLEKLLEAILDQKILAINRFYGGDGSLTLMVKVEKEDRGAAKLASMLLKTSVELEVAKTPRYEGGEFKIKKPDIRKILEKF